MNFMSIAVNLQKIKSTLPEHVSLVAVSKTKPIVDIQQAYDAGQRIFGENKIQEMTEKFEVLPKDIEWHMIGHLQRNKVKYMAPFVNLIHGVDSLKTLKEVNKQALKNNRIINCLLQVKIAKEETKFGLTETEVEVVLDSTDFENLKNIKVLGLMGMASFTDDLNQVKTEFQLLKVFFDKLIIKHPALKTISMGMSGDYQLAVEEGSNMVRVGSAIFGTRNY